MLTGVLPLSKLAWSVSVETSDGVALRHRVEAPPAGGSSAWDPGSSPCPGASAGASSRRPIGDRDRRDRRGRRREGGRAPVRGPTKTRVPSTARARLQRERLDRRARRCDRPRLALHGDGGTAPGRRGRARSPVFARLIETATCASSGCTRLWMPWDIPFHMSFAVRPSIVWADSTVSEPKLVGIDSPTAGAPCWAARRRPEGADCELCPVEREERDTRMRREERVRRRPPFVPAARAAPPVLSSVRSLRPGGTLGNWCPKPAGGHRRTAVDGRADGKRWIAWGALGGVATAVGQPRDGAAGTPAPGGCGDRTVGRCPPPPPPHRGAGQPRRKARTLPRTLNAATKDDCRTPRAHADRSPGPRGHGEQSR